MTEIIEAMKNTLPDYQFKYGADLEFLFTEQQGWGEDEEDTDFIGDNIDIIIYNTLV